MLPEWAFWTVLGIFLLLMVVVLVVEYVLMWDLCKPIKKDVYE